ncbi:hypothetical protein NLX83_32905 [Allokutzneria sp. A3M-2-11 16]|uniref:hypothetical protein n=1 Tax=Allokutzneria sp. A3M-2-11 16 TaxID=2962043 RepID=UPI0020B72D1C|nr:hypothetical protein [Allokutzneria sp. A3M-2-11 16]MCP3804082.1 hypothetical protein [Allokutzneria sp. A3M-2-11 16]
MAERGESKFSKLPGRVLPQEWVEAKDPEPVPQSVLDAEANREQREAINLIERVGW